jgi:hypothetical protein
MERLILRVLLRIWTIKKKSLRIELVNRKLKLKRFTPRTEQQEKKHSRREKKKLTF